jgi:hypothetical protein
MNERIVAGTTPSFTLAASDTAQAQDSAQDRVGLSEPPLCGSWLSVQRPERHLTKRYSPLGMFFLL